MGEREKTTCTVTVVFNCIPMSDQRSLRQRFMNLRLGINLSVQQVCFGVVWDTVLPRRTL